MTALHENYEYYDLGKIASANIRAIMARRGESQISLGSKIGVTGSAVNQRLRGYRTWPMDDVAKVAAVLGVKPWDLVTPPGETNNGPYSRVEAVATETPVKWYTARDSNPEPADIELAEIIDLPGRPRGHIVNYRELAEVRTIRVS